MPHPEPAESVSAATQGAPAPEASDEEVAADTEEQQSVVLRAGGVLLLAATLVGLGMNIVLGASGASAWVPLVIDVAVGAALVTGDSKAKSFAIFRASVGLLFSVALLLGALKVGKRDVAAMLLVQSIVSSSLLVLLWGEAGRLRFRVGLAVGIVAVLLSFAIPVSMLIAH